MIYFTFYESPIQTLRLVSDGRSLTGLYMMSEKHLLTPQGDWEEDESVAPFPETKQQLTAYFSGTLTEFELPLQIQGRGGLVCRATDQPTPAPPPWRSLSDRR